MKILVTFEVQIEIDDRAAEPVVKSVEEMLLGTNYKVKSWTGGENDARCVSAKYIKPKGLL